MTEEVIDPACAVCGRRLLAGETPTSFLTRDWVEVTVCELCKPRAEAAGWLRPEEAEELRSSGASRERRRPRGQMLSGLLSRFPAGQGEAAEPERAAAPRQDRITVRRTTPTTVGPTPADVELAEALRTFNFSDHRRTVGGLTRTLGPPRASALPIETAAGVPGFRVTVAWELTWYQWEIAAGEHGIEVRESGKGDTIDQLRREDRAWNLLVGNDGTLQARTVGSDPGEGAP